MNYKGVKRRAGKKAGGYHEQAGARNRRVPEVGGYENGLTSLRELFQQPKEPILALFSPIPPGVRLLSRMPARVRLPLVPDSLSCHPTSRALFPVRFSYSEVFTGVIRLIQHSLSE